MNRKLRLIQIKLTIHTLNISFLCDIVLDVNLFILCKWYNIISVEKQSQFSLYRNRRPIEWKKA